MTILLVASRNPHATGVDRYAGSLTVALRDKGADVAEVELRRREARLGRLRVGGLASLWWQRTLARRRGEWELVHALDPAAATRSSDVVTVHDLIPETHSDLASGGAAARLDWAISRANARRAKRLIAVSEATRQEIIRRWRVPPERVTVVHHGIAHERFRPTDAAAAHVAPDRPTLVYVGDDNPRKNIGLALAAMVPLREEHGIVARLLRIGPTRFPEAAAARGAFARANGIDLVEPGYLGDVEVAAHCTRAAAFLWPTLAEGFGFPPLEAMACGAPVVALDTPVNREIVGTLGRFHANDARAAAAAIAEALAKPADKAALRAHALRFTWARAAEETMRVYASAKEAS